MKRTMRTLSKGTRIPIEAKFEKEKKPSVRKEEKKINSQYRPKGMLSVIGRWQYTSAKKKKCERTKGMKHSIKTDFHVNSRDPPSSSSGGVFGTRFSRQLCQSPVSNGLCYK